MDPLISTVAVVRTWNNPEIRKRVDALLAFLPHALILVNAAKDTDFTARLLEGISADRITALSLDTGPYFWSLPLNAALRHFDAVGAPYEFFFPCSVEATFERQHLKAMLRAFADPAVGVVGTSFKGIKNGGEVPLGSSYALPRNTGMVIRRAVFAGPLADGFDPACDAFGGMEDADFVNRMEAQTPYRAVMLDLRIPLTVGANWNQMEKEARETEALRKIKELRGQ